MNKIVTMCFVALGFFALAGAASAQSESGALREDRGFSLEFATATVGIDEFDVSQPALGVIPRWCWTRNWCWWIDIWWIDGPWPDPWGGLLIVDDIPVPITDLGVGPGLMVAPAIEYSFQPDNRLRPSLYGGLGVQRDEGATTDIAGVGQFTTSSTTSPVAIFGAAFTYDLSARTALRIGTGGSMLFMGDMDIQGPNGANFNVEGGDTLSGIISVGIDVAF